MSQSWQAKLRRLRGYASLLPVLTLDVGLWTLDSFQKSPSLDNNHRIIRIGRAPKRE
jgi:hypothetical protein